MERFTAKEQSGRELIPLLLGISLAWGLVYIVLDSLLLVFDSLQVLALRWQTAALFFVLYYTARRQKPIFPRTHRTSLIIIGVSQACIYPLTEILGLQYTSVSLVAISEAVIPAVAVLVGILFFKKRTGALGLFSIALAVSGIVICTVFAPDFSAEGRLFGYLMLLLVIFSGSMYNHLSNAVGQDVNALDVTAFIAFTGALVHTVVHFASGYGFKTYHMLLSDWRLTAAVIYAAAIGTITGNILYNRAMAITKASTLTANIQAGLTAIVGITSSILIGRDSASWYIWVGLLLTLTGVLISSKAEAQ